MSGLAISEVATMVGNLFTVYLFGTSEIGITLAFLFVLGIFMFAGWKFQIGADGMILLAGVVGMFAGVFMFPTIDMKAFVGIAFGIILAIGMLRLIRR